MTGMMDLTGIQDSRELINDIDWDMTPEEAVTLYLEWGNNWTHGKNFVRSKNDVSHYFVVNTWDDPPHIYLIRRNSDEAVELAKFPIPEPLRGRFLEQWGRKKGVYGLNEEIRDWLRKEMNAHDSNETLVPMCGHA
jgi:hypothetical protein